MNFGRILGELRKSKQKDKWISVQQEREAPKWVWEPQLREVMRTLQD
jgi:hypothetical protein